MAATPHLVTVALQPVAIFGSSSSSPVSYQRAKRLSWRWWLPLSSFREAIAYRSISLLQEKLTHFARSSVLRYKPQPPQLMPWGLSSQVAPTIPSGRNRRGIEIIDHLLTGHLLDGSGKHIRAETVVYEIGSRFMYQRRREGKSLPNRPSRSPPAVLKRWDRHHGRRTWSIGDVSPALSSKGLPRPVIGRGRRRSPCP